MSVIFSLAVFIILTLLAFVGVYFAGMDILFGVVIPYAAIAETSAGCGALEPATRTKTAFLHIW